MIQARCIIIRNWTGGIEWIDCLEDDIWDSKPPIWSEDMNDRCAQPSQDGMILRVERGGIRFMHPSA